MELLDAKRKLEKRYDRQNDYNRKNYDRVSVMLPAGERDKIREIAKSQNKSLNAFILEAIEEKVNKIE